METSRNILVDIIWHMSQRKYQPVPTNLAYQLTAIVMVSGKRPPIWSCAARAVITKVSTNGLRFKLNVPTRTRDLQHQASKRGNITLVFPLLSLQPTDRNSFDIAMIYGITMAHEIFQ